MTTNDLNKDSKFLFYREKLGNPQNILAPMVDGSDLTFRILVRRHGVNLCYTPMVLSKMFVESKVYRNEVVNSLDPKEQPIIIQIVGSDANEMARTAKFLQSYCDAIDINLGCPQKIAQKGNYGAYLALDFDHTKEIVNAVIEAVNIPVYCKVRVFEDEEKTMRFVEMLQECGIWGIAVHGRTITEKQSMNYHARWNYIAKIKERLKIPVIANGEMRSREKIEECKKVTHSDGYMIGFGLLMNPGMCEGTIDNNEQIAEEYINIVFEYKDKNLVRLSDVKGHLIKMMLYKIKQKKDLLKEIGEARSFEECKTWLEKVIELNRKRNIETSENDKEIKKDII
ncbi:dihydrouridine synthase family protein [Entamoeba histolytica HM-1:IMSS-B]|uniref:tRNA-dihydrouridine synthase n=6 Tax=Entamoeba histolytica TaxID=5759 RepID=C4M1X1_ENTH1|nr:dihydrouridine synthase (Dus) family protein [Entamoeba histolytica HM-1:IMSS]EMD44804.1 tRNA-dihydrouridine synthase, putative [Entamoeba histolytica KU27]EMH73297.1 dihydrouridine synthase family protein [Entamoeba histolytica HM-1:IMSS-B]EMS11151.1 tRNA-dihydrouridine synthase, putative [Entamoeba histolytica HM-3:IMSS]ENY65570.1 tRNA-dihydrouridine synthase, putative [Entamoeba histolytica HM-1:IMSS-A]GAT95243.1 dihydrouridine synthase dus family protein [Entamoeba histolytica]|eukprot:XP_655192.1 dihydrouridine synthase (Dus) family protein [Entamoeba histolytica HM-1:IMSS]